MHCHRVVVEWASLLHISKAGGMAVRRELYLWGPCALAVSPALLVCSTCAPLWSPPEPIMELVESMMDWASPPVLNGGWRRLADGTRVDLPLHQWTTDRLATPLMEHGSTCPLHDGVRVDLPSPWWTLANSMMGSGGLHDGVRVDLPVPSICLLVTFCSVMHFLQCDAPYLQGLHLLCATAPTPIMISYEESAAS